MGDLKHDIEKYLRGELSSAERNALERKALQDPFLADALEGAASIDVEDFSSDLKSLQASLQDRIADSKVKVVPLWNWTLRIAAGLLVVAIGSFVIWQLNQQNDNDNLLSENTPKKEAPDNSASTPIRDEIMDTAYAGVESSVKQDATSEAETEREVEYTNGDHAVAGLRTEVSDTQPREEEPQMIALQEQLAETSPAKEVVMDSVVTLQPKPVDALAGHTAGVQVSPSASAPENRDFKIATERAKKKESDSSVALDYSPNAQGEGVIGNSMNQSERKSSAPVQIRMRGTASVGPADDDANYVIVGKVTDAEDGDGLPGVNVLVKGTNYGTVTDGEGNYKLKVDELDPSLIFTFVGMESKEIKIEDEREVNVAMVNDMTQLSEIVVVGYGAEKVEEDPGRMEFASPMGGRAEFKKYLEGNLRYPQQALTNEIEGKVTIQFTVATSGDLSEFRVVRGIGYGCDDEVIRLIKKGPKWYPTRKGGEPVAGKMRVKVRFRLPKKD